MTGAPGSAKSSLCLQMTRELLFLSTDLWITALPRAGSILGNGSVLRRQPVASSGSFALPFLFASTSGMSVFVLICTIRALANSQPGSLRVYTTGDFPDVYEDSFLKIARSGPSGAFHPTLILVGTRLGVDKMNTVYWEALTSALQMPQSVGIAG